MDAAKQANVEYAVFGVVALGAIAAAIAFGRTSTHSYAPTGVDPQALVGVANAAAQNHAADVNLMIERTRDAANSLTTLKGLEEQVQLGQISLEEARIRYMNETEQARIRAGAEVQTATLASQSAVESTRITSAAQVTQAQAAAGAQKTSSFWGSVGGILKTVGGFFGL